MVSTSTQTLSRLVLNLGITIPRSSGLDYCGAGGVLSRRRSTADGRGLARGNRRRHPAQRLAGGELPSKYPAAPDPCPPAAALPRGAAPVPHQHRARPGGRALGRALLVVSFPTAHLPRPHLSQLL